MKILYSLLVAAFLGIGMTANSQLNITLTDNEASLVIDGNTSRMDLINARTALLERGIDFKYSFQFNNETRIQSIDFTVSANDGAITGSGVHNSLQSQGAKVNLYINKSTGTCTVDIQE